MLVIYALWILQNNFFFLSKFHNVAQVILKREILPPLQCQVTGMDHHVWLKNNTLACKTSVYKSEPKAIQWETEALNVGIQKQNTADL